MSVESSDSRELTKAIAVVYGWRFTAYIRNEASGWLFSYLLHLYYLFYRNEQ